MKETLTVLVTGMGGPLGVSVLKALTLSSLPLRLLGTDTDPRSFGLYLTDKSFILPRADTHTRDYIFRLLELIAAERIDAIFPCSESEIIALADNIDYFAKVPCLVNVAPRHVLERVMDKYHLARDLKAAGLLGPESTIPGAYDFEEFVRRHGFPLILKARLDSGSRNLHRINNRQELDFFCGYVRNPVVQEVLLPDNEEYTIGVFVAPEGRGEGTIILRRQLAAGLTFKADVVEDAVISQVCLDVVKHFSLTGANNVQLRVTGKGPQVFEINARFSSSTVIRAYFGFNEPELVLRALVLKEKVAPRPVSSGIALRMWDELYVDASVAEAFKTAGQGERLGFGYGVSLPRILERRRKHNA